MKKILIRKLVNDTNRQNVFYMVNKYMKLFDLINNKNIEIKIVMRYFFVFTSVIVFDNT